MTGVTHMGNTEQLLGKVNWQAHTAVRRRIAGQLARVQRHAVPGQAVHVRHRSVVADGRVVMLVLLQHGEDAGGRLMPFLSSGAGGHRHAYPVAVDMDQLLRDRDDHGHRPLGRELRIPGVFAGQQCTRPLVDSLCVQQDRDEQR